MRKILGYVLSVAISLVLCGLMLFVPVGEGALWFRPCVNVYSVFGVAFFIMNSVGLCVIAYGSDVVKKSYTKERPIIEEKKRRITPVVMAFFEVPLLVSVFFVDGGWKMVVCTGLYLGSLILGSLVGEMSANTLRKEFAEMEQKELAEQLRKEEGC